MEARELHASSGFIAKPEFICVRWHAERAKIKPMTQFNRHRAIQPVSSETGECTGSPDLFIERIERFFGRALLAMAAVSLLFVFGPGKMVETEYQNPATPVMKMEETLPDRHLPIKYKDLNPEIRPKIKILPPIAGLTA